VPPPRTLHPWQAFSKLYSDDLNPKVTEEWKKFKVENPDTTTTFFAYRNSLMQKWYAEASPVIKAKVESFRQEEKEDSRETIEGNDDTSCMTGYQK